MKRLLAVIIMIAALTSCSSTGNSGSAVTENSASENETDRPDSSDEIKEDLMNRTNCYRSEDFALPDDMTDILSAYRLGDGRVALGLTDSDFNEKYYISDGNFMDFTPFSYEIPEDVESADFYFGRPSFRHDGSLLVLYTTEDHNGVKAPDEYDQNFDYDSYNSNFTTSHYICSYDSSGELLSTNPVEYPQELYSEEGYLLAGDCTAYGDNIFQGFEDGSIRKISTSGEITTVYTDESSGDPTYMIPKIAADRDGNLVAVLYEQPDDVTAGLEMKFFDITEDGVADEPLYTCQENEYSHGELFGAGEYRLLIPTYDGVIGIKGDGTTETAIDWKASSLDSMSVIPAEDGTYIGRYTQTNASFPTIVRLVPRDMSELADTKIITVSVPSEFFNISSEINSFNNSQTEYRAETIEYDGSYGDYISQLNMDIISGKAPDVISGLDYENYMNYCNKSAFEELTPYFDDELSLDMILPNVTAAFQREDGLYALCSSFNVRTLVTKSKINDKENWTFDDMLALYDNPPSTADHLYDSQSKTDAFQMMSYTMSDFIDFEHAECDFNNSRFIDILNFCNRFVESENAPTKVDDYGAWEDYTYGKMRWFGEDRVLFDSLNMYDLSAYNLLKYTLAGGEDLTFAGYPSENGKGGRIVPGDIISINASSTEKEGAWEFVKHYIIDANDIEEEYEQGQYIERIPSFTASLERLMELQNAEVHTAGGEEYPSYTEAEMGMILDYIKSCDTVGVMLDDEIGAILEEESEIFFEGEQSAELAAEHIQDRLSILLSEKS
ncbi:MAG: extracellular solute-binding protein [Ruminococcus sp.]|nr:extracellular solute-binding protein [Ruminococcus sp.]MBP3380810.1 extracellular solute-binding protein [Ruminococcus sp.]